MVNVIMHGCNGRMGRYITDLIKQDDAINIVAGVDPYQGITNDYPVYSSIDEVEQAADAVIDFSNAGVADSLLDWCVAKKSPAFSVRPDYQRISLQSWRRLRSR